MRFMRLVDAAGSIPEGTAEDDHRIEFEPVAFRQLLIEVDPAFDVDHGPDLIAEASDGPATQLIE